MGGVPELKNPMSLRRFKNVPLTSEYPVVIVNRKRAYVHPGKIKTATRFIGDRPGSLLLFGGG
jgi:hypothetical protein